MQQDATMYQNFIIPYLYEARETPPIIRSLKLHWQPLVFHAWKVVWTCNWWTLSGTLFCIYMKLNMFRATHRPHSVPDNVPPTTHPTTFHLRKTRGCQCSFRLLMMGGVSPETWWASYKCVIMCLTTSTNYTSNNLPLTKNQRLPVQF